MTYFSSLGLMFSHPGAEVLYDDFQDASQLSISLLADFLYPAFCIHYPFCQYRQAKRLNLTAPGQQKAV